MACSSAAASIFTFGREFFGNTEKPVGKTSKKQRMFQTLQEHVLIDDEFDQSSSSRSIKSEVKDACSTDHAVPRNDILGLRKSLKRSHGVRCLEEQQQNPQQGKAIDIACSTSPTSSHRIITSAKSFGFRYLEDDEV